MGVIGVLLGSGDACDLCERGVAGIGGMRCWATLVLIGTRLERLRKWWVCWI